MQVESVPLSYSVDLRWRLVWLSMVHRMTSSAISLQMCISERSVKRYLRLFQLTGNVKLKSQRHGPQPLLGDYEQLILHRLIAKNTGIYLHELQHKLHDLFGVTISVSTICRTLRRMG